MVLNVPEQVIDRPYCVRGYTRHYPRDVISDLHAYTVLAELPVQGYKVLIPICSPAKAIGNRSLDCITVTNTGYWVPVSLFSPGI